MESCHEELVATIPSGSSLYYSLKANPHPSLVAALASRGCGAEVSSPRELDVALQSVPLDRCIYTGPGKTDADIAYAIAKGVTRFSVESATELKRLRALSDSAGRQTKYLLRVNSPGGARTGLRMTGRPSQFGVDLSQLEADHSLFVSSDACQFVGLHFFPASNVADEAHLADIFEHSIATAAQLCANHDVQLRELNLGGGFAAPFGAAGGYSTLTVVRDRLAEALDAAFPQRAGSRPMMAFESGRRLVAASGTLLTRVIDVKLSGGRRFAIAESGANHLGGFGALQRVMRSQIMPRVIAQVMSSSPDGSGGITLVGPTGAPPDIVVDDMIGLDVASGDLLAFDNVGAYGLTASLVAFLSRDFPAEIVHDGDTIVSATRMALPRIEISELE